MTDAFTLDDLDAVVACVIDAWTRGLERDWSARAGRLEWSCSKTADHAVDTVLAPAFFLASRRTDTYPDGGWSPGETAAPQAFIDGVGTAARILAGVVRDAPPPVEAILFRNPHMLGAPLDFVPRAGLELVLHAHDVCAGLGIEFDPPRDACEHLRTHVAGWPFWGAYWPALSMDGDPWIDLLRSSRRVP